LTRMNPGTSDAERDQHQQPVLPSVSGEAYVTLDPYGGVRQVPETDKSWYVKSRSIRVTTTGGRTCVNIRGMCL
jgi:hypothetical protein